jgi:uncharacterized protein (TIGR01777 family)
MKIVVSGGTGFIGQPLTARLAARGDEVVVLTRNPAKVRSGRGVAWDPPRRGPWWEEVARADAVINLAGENIGDGRWTAARKERLISSRLDATGSLVEAMRTAPQQKRVFLSASAVGFYGNRGDEELDESAGRGAGFLADLTARWEEAAHGADGVARVVVPRFGVVLERSGGALQKMLPPFRFGVGGPLGSGRQWMSWVDREDALRFLEWALGEEVSGPFNVTAPEPVRNRDFTRELGHALHRPAFMPVPGFALRLLFGQMADETLLAGQRVIPRRATDAGFRFTAPTLPEALAHVL